MRRKRKKNKKKKQKKRKEKVFCCKKIIRERNDEKSLGEQKRLKEDWSDDTEKGGKTRRIPGLNCHSTRKGGISCPYKREEPLKGRWQLSRVRGQMARKISGEKLSRKKVSQKGDTRDSEAQMKIVQRGNGKGRRNRKKKLRKVILSTGIPRQIS